MNVEELFTKICNKASEFGLKAKNEGKTIIDSKGNAIIRKNLFDISFTEKKAFFGFINGEEDTSGPYSDFSFVIFPDKKDDIKYCVIALGVGSAGFKNDYEMAVLPGLRRTFLKLRTNDNNTFFKTSFDDIENPSKDLLKEVGEKCPDLNDVITSYKTVLPASCIVNMQEKNEDEGLKTIYTWLATYAKIRNWGTKKQKGEIDKVLNDINYTESREEIEEIKQLLEKRKYVVLQGAPGTGKTYSALNIAKKYSKTFFEQFHAETNYSDFVYGIEPNLEDGSDKSKFVKKEGVLYKAIKYAKDNSSEEVLLIIDEINRANLSNVLGPIFYLFEHQSGKRTVEIKIGKDLEICKLPDNLHVIATMNTADRSLAVVDFALRRRFAWYTLRPHKIKADEGYKFMKETYNKIADIFYEYATDDELNLQPGQSYFIVPSSDEEKENEFMKERLIYEVMPLIKEYLAEGYLLNAKDSFFDFFLKETDILMYE